MFVFRKLIGALLMPLPLTLALAWTGVGLLRWSGRTRLARGMLTGALALLTLVSLAPVSAWLAAPLERAYPAFPGDSVDAVVVLGSGHGTAPHLPPTSVLSSSALYRLVEGMRIARAQPWARLVLSGYGGAEPRANAEAYRDLAVALGFDPGRIMVEPRPRDTAEEARLLDPVLRGHPFALVTSATHMRRALALFRREGLDPVPAPTDHRVREARAFRWLYLLPDESALLTSRMVWHEVLGYAWFSLMGDFGEERS